MLPRWHILLGFIFSIIIYLLFPNISLISILLIFLSSFLIDFDHYLVAVIKTRKLSLFSAFRFFDEYGKQEKIRLSNGIKQKGPLMIFHTLEFHILILIAGILISSYFYAILTGTLFHSICDIIYLKRNDYLYHREFLLIKELLKKI